MLFLPELAISCPFLCLFFDDVHFLYLYCFLWSPDNGLWSTHASFLECKIFQAQMWDRKKYLFVYRFLVYGIFIRTGLQKQSFLNIQEYQELHDLSAIITDILIKLWSYEEQVKITDHTLILSLQTLSIFFSSYFKNKSWILPIFNKITNLWRRKKNHISKYQPRGLWI